LKFHELEFKQLRDNDSKFDKIKIQSVSPPNNIPSDKEQMNMETDIKLGLHKIDGSLL